MTLDLETIVLLITISVLTLLIMTLMELRKQPKKPEYETIELLECIQCRYRLERPFEPGDFISMYKGKCPKCGSPLRIKAIYNVEKSFKHP